MSNVKVRFLAETSNFKKGAKEAETAMGKLGKSIGSSFSPANLLAPLAAAASFQKIAQSIGDATRAYYEDRKAQDVMNLAIRNNTNATLAQQQAAQDAIATMERQTGILDDVLRPAYTNIVASVGDTTVATDLLSTALDISAGTGKDVQQVSLALAKAYNGSFTALSRLLPGIEKNSKGLEDLKHRFAGAAEAAGKQDPFARFNVILNDLQEQIGEKFAPAMDKFMAYFESEDGKAALKDFSLTIDGMGIALEKLTSFFTTNDFGKYIGTFLSFTTPLGQLGMLFKGMGLEAEEAGLKVKAFMKIYRDEGDRMGVQGLAPKFAEVIPEVDNTIKVIADRIKNGADKIKASGDKFKESISFGDYLNKDTNMFDSTKFMEKFRGIIAAAKALPARLRALRKAGASPEVLQQIVAMGPEQGLAVAQGFLDNAGSAKEYSSSLKTLGVLGQTTMANAAGNKAYTINVTKANMTAEEIIREIQKYERKTGKKVVF